MDYPHTTINADLRTLRMNLQYAGHDDLVAIVDRITEQYRQKREYFASLTGATSEVATSKYPHTSIQDNLANLIQSLEESGSPERETRLGLAREIEREYTLKREWFKQFR